MAKNTTNKSSKVKAQTAIKRQPQQTAIVRATPKTKALGGRIVRENGRGPQDGRLEPLSWDMKAIHAYADELGRPAGL